MQIEQTDYIKNIVSLTPSIVAGRIAVIPDDVWELAEPDLEVRANAGEVERKLRIGWALELERATRTESQMNMHNVFRGTCTEGYFKRHIVTSSYKLAYIIKPFAEFNAELQDIFNLLTNDMRSIVSRPLVNEEGKFDHKLAVIKKDLWEGLADRIHGSAAKKLEIQSKSINLNIAKDANAQQPQSLAAINERIKELEAAEAQAITYRDVTDGQEV